MKHLVGEGVEQLQSSRDLGVQAPCPDSEHRHPGTVPAHQCLGTYLATPKICSAYRARVAMCSLGPGCGMLEGCMCTVLPSSACPSRFPITLPRAGDIFIAWNYQK